MLSGFAPSAMHDVAGVPTDAVRDTDADYKSATVAIVDDEPVILSVLQKYLRAEGYRDVVTTTQSASAIEFFHDCHPDAILLDVMMPDVDGIEVLRRISEDERLCRIPVLVLTATTDRKIRQRALELGASDFLSKPIDFVDFVPRVRNSIKVKLYQDRLHSHNQELGVLVRERTAQLEESRREIVQCLARAGEFRDDQTGNHVLRVGRYVGIIARELGYSEAICKDLEIAAQLHDVGKIGIPDDILFSPDRLSREEFEHIHRHCGFGRKIIKPVGQDPYSDTRSHVDIGAKLLQVSDSSLMTLAASIAQTHHERWDGTGYPLGLAGQDIPIEGRMTSVADVFDALSSKRPYKPAFPREKCFAIMEEGRSSQFDPAVLDAFFSCREAIVETQIRFMVLD